MKYFWLLALVVLAACSGNTASEEETFTKVEITTPQGRLVIALYNDTPIHRDNFIQKAKEGYYNDLLFHRVVPGFIVQGGDPASRNAQTTQLLGVSKCGDLLPREGGFHPHIRGAVAAARLPDAANPEKKSSPCQFFIVDGRPIKDYQIKQIGTEKGIQYTPEHIKDYTELGGFPQLDLEYTVFGQVIEGFETLELIANAEVMEFPRERPAQDIPMQVRVLEQ